MNETTKRQLTCAERVEQAWQSRKNDLATLLDPGPDDCCLEKQADGWCFTWLDRYQQEVTDTELIGANEEAAAGLYESATEALFSNYEDEVRDAAREAFAEYGLAFDYVAPKTFPDQNEGYWRYQISWGGPTEEIRFYASPGPNTGDFTVYRAEFWYLDCFDGDNVNVTDDAIANEIYEWFHDMGAVGYALETILD